MAAMQQTPHTQQGRCSWHCNNYNHSMHHTRCAVALLLCVCAAGDVVLCSAASGWVAPAVAKVDKKKKKGKGEEAGQQQQQGGADAELDPEKAAKKVCVGGKPGVAAAQQQCINGCCMGMLWAGCTCSGVHSM
jgi:hypothetical protein